MAAEGGLVGRLLQEVEVRAGLSVVPNERLELLEQAFTDLRSTQRELDLLGYTALDYMSSNPKELRPETRRSMAQKALVTWMYDPQIARSVSMLNDFTFGRGVPQPRAKDKKVQEKLDDFWNDLDNKILVTSHDGQVAMGVDLSLQSNLFLLIFDQGKDGKIKVGLLNHDSVEEVVEDEENRLRVLYYVARESTRKWDYTQRKYVVDRDTTIKGKTKYYEHYANVKSLEADGIPFDKPPAAEMGVGLVYQIAVNRTTEMHFGVPELMRVIRWAAAYNDFMSARVDMMKAAAAFVMKRKSKATPNQLSKLATRAISRQSPIAGVVDPYYPTAGRAAAILNENDMVSHEGLKIDSGAANATQDAGLLHGQISAGTGVPRHYLGNGDANLATATAMELFVLKMVESRQEVFEGLYRAIFDMVIQKAIDDGQLDANADPSDDEPVDQMVLDPYSAAEGLVEAGLIEADELEKAVELLRQHPLREVEDEAQQERDTKRDLTYEFSMPSPLRRMMTDLVTAIQGIATTFDPNNTNVELSRALLAIALGEGLEVDDPADLVDKIFPPGYVDPIFAAAQAQGGPDASGAPPNLFTPQGRGRPVPGVPGTGQDGGDEGAGGQGYGAPASATAPENVPGAQEAFRAVRGRDGQIMFHLVEAPVRDARPDEDEALVVQIRGRSTGLDAMFDTEVGQLAMAELSALTVGAPTNGNGAD